MSVKRSSSTVIIILALILPFASPLSHHSNLLHKFHPYPHSFSVNEPVKRAGHRLFKNFIGDDGRVYACSEKNFFSFEKNGSIAWTVHLNYTCNANIAPVHGGSRKIYLVAENRVLKINPQKTGASEADVQVFFGHEAGEIIGISASVSTSCVLINVRNRGLFAYRMSGQLLWSAGPVLYQHGYRQGCRRNITDCYFTSAPVVDHCEASIFISNTVGELYSLSVRGPFFKWIRDLSSFGNVYTVTPGNNGRVYVTVPEKALILALDVPTGNVLWQQSIGPLSSADYVPVVDANGWISYGSLDGFLYSFSPSGALRKFPKSGRLESVIQVCPVLDCSGYAVYISQAEMEGKFSQEIGGFIHVSALKPKSVAFAFLVPDSGSIYWSEKDPSKFLFNLSQSDLKHFVVDETTLLAFFAVTRNGDSLPCRSTRQKLASSCSQVKPKSLSIYTGNERTIVLFLLIESVLLVLLSVLVAYCCIFWKKKKLQGLDLGKFLEKRRSLRSQKKAFDRMITELEQKATEEAVANEVLEKLGELVKEREGISRKLSTTYSLGRDGEKTRTKPLLPLHDGKPRSYSFQGSKKENVTLFHTLSDSDSSMKVEVAAKARAKGKGPVEEESSSYDETLDSSSYDEIPESSSDSEGFVSPLFLKKNDGVKLVESRSLRRRTVSFTD
ncbi:hypothetical protein ACS0TY_028593 [Phlomoides rotata]